MPAPSLLLTLLAACFTDKGTTDWSLSYPDADGDGAPSSIDCDDSNAEAQPGNAETWYDGVDGDCDVLSDFDQDGDGYVADDYAPTLDDIIDGLPGGDCDDTNQDINPRAPEAETADGIDSDCDGQDIEDATVYVDAWEDNDGDGYGDPETGTSIPEDDTEGYVFNDDDCDDTNPDVNILTWYADTDGDGLGDPDNPATSAALDTCELPEGYVENTDDCDDNNLDVGVITWYEDADSDGYGNPDSFVTSTETGSCLPPEGYVDNADDCDDLDAIVGIKTWYEDNDTDGYGSSTSTTSVEEGSCDTPLGHVDYDGDCDDTSTLYNPDADESCTDTEDYNCDGSIGYTDADVDGFAACEECDDSDPAINPDAIEVCDGADNNCDGTIDEDTASDARTWYEDSDGDGYGNPLSTQAACTRPAGFVSNTSDCDDTDPTTNVLTWYEDIDEDGYGNASSSTDSTVTGSCTTPTGYTADATDCDDTDPTRDPGETEVCDAFDTDEDCSGAADNDDLPTTGLTTFYPDGEGDGYGDTSSTGSSLCDATATYSTTDHTDCDDGDNTIHPGASEICDSVDEDCDGTADDSATDASTWYYDGDSDGYGASSPTTAACTAPTGYVATSGDCDDGDADRNPGETEVCDTSNTDEDCDGTADNNDLPATGLTTFFPDVDNDTYGDETSTGSNLCDATTTYEVSNNTDCDDGNANRYTGSTVTDSTIDGLPNDCSLSYEGPFATTVSGIRYTGTDLFGYGNTTLAAGNFNGDGYDDILAGEPYSDTAGINAGAAFAVLGSASPASSAIASAASHTSTGEAAGDNYGLAVANAGDVDGDGYDEAFVGAPFANSTYLYGAGYLFYGPLSGTVSASSANAIIDGLSANEYMGWAATHADIDGDGDDELLTSAAGYSSNTGAVLLFDGSGTRYSGAYDRTDADALMTGTSSGDVAGASMSTGDVDGDGTPDLAVSQTEYDASDTGRVNLVLGTDITSGTLDSISWITIDGAASSKLGHQVLIIPDMDGDGQDEVLVCAPYETVSASYDGACHLFLTNGANSATFSAAAGGSLDTTDADYTLTGPATEQNLFGNSAAAADTDGDGVAEIALSAYSDDTYGTDAGLVGLWNGATLLGFTPGTFSIDTDQEGLTRWYGATDDEAGTAMVFADPDGDGDYDLFIASPKASSQAGTLDMQRNAY